MCLAFALMTVLQACGNNSKGRVGLPAASSCPQHDNVCTHNTVKCTPATPVKPGGELSAQQPASASWKFPLCF